MHRFLFIFLIVFTILNWFLLPGLTAVHIRNFEGADATNESSLKAAEPASDHALKNSDSQAAMRRAQVPVSANIHVGR